MVMVTIMTMVVIMLTMVVMMLTMVVLIVQKQKLNFNKIAIFFVPGEVCGSVIGHSAV